MKLLGNLKEGMCIVLSAPSGGGKTTLVKKLFAEFPDSVVQSVTCTTRAPRDGEVDGKDYYFLSKEEFEKKKEAGEFLEWVELFGNFYGTLKNEVVSKQKKGKHVMLVIDTQGALSIRDSLPGLYIFVAPPSLSVLEERLRGRHSESEEALKRRISIARSEIQKASEYDYQIINDDLEIAYQVLRSIVIAEEHRRIPHEHLDE